MNRRTNDVRDSDPRVTLLLSIDTEEDNWTPTREGASVANIRALPQFHQFLRELGVRPTYYAAYQVLHQRESAAILRDLGTDERCEIGAHLHAWNTPPTEETLGGANTMLLNLPPVLQRRKLETLTQTFADSMGSLPRTFRTGRFGMGAALLPALVELGYTTDSSVTPYWSWRTYDSGPDFRGAPLHPYRLARSTRDPRLASRSGDIWELPVSVGFSRRPYAFWSCVHALTDTRPLRAARVPGIAARLGLRKAILSPEGETTEDLLAVSRHLVRESGGYLHVFLHSSSLVPGLTPFTPTAQHVERLHGRIRDFIQGLGAMMRVEFATASGYAAGLGGADRRGAVGIT